jgi:hypothetical protein
VSTIQITIVGYHRPVGLSSKKCKKNRTDLPEMLRQAWSAHARKSFCDESSLALKDRMH